MDILDQLSIMKARSQSMRNQKPIR